MESNETASTELEARLRTHYESLYGEPGSGVAVWAGIAGRMGRQEGRESVEFARSVEALYNPNSRAAERTPAQSTESRTRHSVAQRPTFLRPTWRPAITAGLMLALVAALVVALMALTGRNGERTMPAAIPDGTSAGVLEYIDLENPGFEEGLDPWIKASQPYQTSYSVGVDDTVAHSGSASALLKSIVADPKGNAT
jgi:hypothetical protein